MSVTANRNFRKGPGELHPARKKAVATITDEQLSAAIRVVLRRTKTSSLKGATAREAARTIKLNRAERTALGDRVSTVLRTAIEILVAREQLQHDGQAYSRILNPA